MWTDKMREALDVLFEGFDDKQQLLSYMEEAAKAQAVSDKLDDLGIQRKSVTPGGDAQTLHGPGGLLAEPGVENGKAMDEGAEGKKCPKCGGTMKDGKCTKCGYEEGKKAVPTPPTGERHDKGLRPDTPAQALLGTSRPLLTSDLTEMYKAIADVIDQRVQKAIADVKTVIYADVSKALKERDEYLADVTKKIEELPIIEQATLVQTGLNEVTEAVKTHQDILAQLYESQQRIEAIDAQIKTDYNTPRITEIFKNLAASQQDATVVGETDPLAKAHPAETADSTFAHYGLKPANGNGRAAS